MKKYSFLCILIVLSIFLTACGGGKISSNLKTHEVESQLYDEEDIYSAIETIKSEFRDNWDGCTLTEIYYAGDDVSKDYQEWADRHDADEVIVLLSSFTVGSDGIDAGLEPNSTYTGWNWILVRNDGEKWIHVDHGY